MAEGKRYYWLKLKDDFFTSKRIKKLRSMAGGDTYTIIYLKMQLLAMKSDGIIQWTGLEDNVADELALDLDEKPDDVSVTLMYLLKTGLAETEDNISFFLPYVVENTGSETASTQRVREFRQRQKMLQSNADETQEKRLCNVEIEKEIDTEIEKDKEIEIDKPRARGFTPPTIEEVMAYARERNSSVDPVKFFEYYYAGGWKDAKGNPIRNWKQKFLTWEREDKKPQSKNTPVKRSMTLEEQVKNYKLTPGKMSALQSFVDSM